MGVFPCSGAVWALTEPATRPAGIVRLAAVRPAISMNCRRSKSAGMGNPLGREPVDQPRDLAGDEGPGDLEIVAHGRTLVPVLDRPSIDPIGTEIAAERHDPVGIGQPRRG